MIKCQFDTTVLIMFLVNNDMSELAEKCIPFISEYTDCTEANLCSGCTKCQCTSNGDWDCKIHSDCSPRYEALGDSELDYAMDVIQNEIQKKKQYQNHKELVPRPERLEKKVPLKRPIDKILESMLLQQDIAKEMLRESRSVKNNENDKIKFHNVIDELNEDTLKNTNSSGTIQAAKVKPNFIKTPEKKNMEGNINISTNNDLHIEYSKPNVNDVHITENKIDSKPHDVYLNVLSNTKLSAVSNISRKEKDKVLSKLVVNELRTGEEIIGNEQAPSVSNITFTAENDSLTAIAFIAGNLLNKLWKLENTSAESFETETLKHEKISELIDLFKEPLTIKKESLLKNALDKLSKAIDNQKGIDNITLCHEVAKTVESEKTRNKNDINNQTISSPDKSNIKKEDEISAKAINKLNNVLDLIEQFEDVQKSLRRLEQKRNDTDSLPKIMKDLSIDPHLSEDESQSLNVFGNLLQKMTKLFTPSKHKNLKKVENSNLFRDVVSLPINIKEKYQMNTNDLSSKDRLILDYLSKVQNVPHCFFENSKFSSDLHGSGDILYNLSEFFKIKSFVDLLKLIEPEKRTLRPTITYPTTFAPTTTTTKATTTTSIPKDLRKFTETKEKLKNHLKSIIDDLVEIRKDKALSKSELVNAIPCLNDFLNSEEFSEMMQRQNEGSNKQKDLKETIQNLKDGLKADTPKRRMDVENNEDRPKSAIVWERVVNSISQNRKNRRNLYGSKPKSFAEIKMLINATNFLESKIVGKIIPQNKLILLKATQLNINEYIQVLEAIKVSLESLVYEPKKHIKELNNYIKSTANNLDIKKNMVKSIANNEDKMIENENSNDQTSQEVKKANFDYKSAKDKKVIKVSRNQIFNQLMRNRIQFFIRRKEAQGVDAKDMKYILALKILRNLELGNNNVAKELYKAFVLASDNNENQKGNSGSKIEEEPSWKSRTSSVRVKPTTEQKKIQSLVEQLKSMSKDQLIKQLISMKNSQ